jgi:PAS domain S-box-containing protein
LIPFPSKTEKIGNRSKAHLARKLSNPDKRSEKSRKDEGSKIQAGKTMKASEELYRVLFEASADGILIADIKTKTFKFANPALCRMFGYTEREIKKLSVEDIHPPENLKDILAEFEVQAKGEKILAQDIPCLKKDGSVFYADIATTKCLIDERECNIGLFRDITKKKRMEENHKRKTKELEERIKELNCLYGVNEILRKEEISIEEALKETVKLLPGSLQFPEICGARIVYKGQIFKTKRFKQTRWMQKEHISVDKQKVGSIEVSYLKEKRKSDEGPFLKEERDLIQSVAERIGKFIEVQDKKEALKNSEERLRILFEYAPDAYYLNDFAGNLVDGNRMAEKLTGYRRDELIGKKFLKLNLVPPNQMRKTAQLLARSIRGKATGPDELTLIRKDGKQVQVEIRTYPVKIKGKHLVLGIAHDITRRKQMEDSLQFSDAAFESIQESVVATDLQYNITHWNHVSEKMYGIKTNDAVGKKLFDVIEIVENSPNENAKRIKHLETEGYYSDVQLHRTKNKEVWVSVSVQEIRYKRKRKGWVSLATDITDRKKAEEQITLLSNAVKMAMDSITIVDTQGRIRDANEAMLKLHGFKDKASVIGKPVLDLVAPKDRQKAGAGFKQVWKNGKITEEYDVLKVDGNTIPVETSTTVMRDKDGNLMGLVAVTRDITERKEAEEKLKLEKAYIDQLFESAQEAIVLADTDGRIVRANNDFLDLFGFRDDEVVGQPLDEIIAPEDFREIAMSITEKVTMGDSVSLETVRQRKDGTLIDVSVLASPIFVDETLVGVYGIYRNITDRKKAEEKLKASLKEKEVLLREIHHRVKNNLQVISSLLTLQSNQIKGKKNMEFFKDSQNRVKSMALIHEKLYQSHNLARINFKEYLSTLVNGLFRSYHTRSSNITLKLDVEDVSLEVDSAIPCGLIVNELVSNSLKYAFPDERKGEIRVALRSLNKKNIELVVSDNGIGIPDDFDVRKAESLGLHLVTILAEDQLDGEIKLSRDHGTEFRIILGVLK